MSFRLGLSVIWLVLCASVACGGGASAKPTGIFVTPRSSTAWANSAQDRVAYGVLVGYSDGHDAPLTSGIQWAVQGYWVGFDATTAVATCDFAAPQGAFNIPQSAIIKATATVGGQTFTDSAILDCF